MARAQRVRHAVLAQHFSGVPDERPHARAPSTFDWFDYRERA
ncbi:hypothetical protein [Crossiella sp. CA198]